MSEIIDKESKESIVKRMADKLSVLQPQNIFIKFEEDRPALEIKIISDIFTDYDQLERIKIVSDTIFYILENDLIEYETKIIPLTKSETGYLTY
jgi:hypothetical protein